MSPKENLYYAIGELAYAVAKADGAVQKEEKEKFQQLVTKAMEKGKHGFEISGIIFTIMDRDNASLPDSYHWAIKEIRRNSQHLSPEMKKCFIDTMAAVAMAYPPVTIEESDLMKKFVQDIEPLKGDPALYN
jgi:uncharacterized tellurite resistance protein B-like protein